MDAVVGRQIGAVIHDLDTTLAAWLGVLLPGVPVSFDVDGRDSEPDGSSALSLHLFDVQEEPGAGTAGWAPLRDADGRMIGRLPPLHRYRFRYLMTATAKETLDEHELLGRVLTGCALHEVVPHEHLTGSFAAAEAEVLVRCAPARPDGPPQPGEGWRVSRRTTLELSVLAPLVLDAMQEVASAPTSIDLGTHRLGTDRGPGPGDGRGDDAARPDDRPLPSRPAHRITEG